MTEIGQFSYRTIWFERWMDMLPYSVFSFEMHLIQWTVWEGINNELPKIGICVLSGFDYIIHELMFLLICAAISRNRTFRGRAFNAHINGKPFESSSQFSADTCYLYLMDDSIWSLKSKHWFLSANVRDIVFVCEFQRTDIFFCLCE